MGQAVVMGHTFSPDFPVADALQPANAGDADLFVSKSPHTQVALDDAIEQGELFCNMLRESRRHSRA